MTVRSPKVKQKAVSKFGFFRFSRPNSAGFTPSPFRRRANDSNSAKADRGFTLIELLVVIAIIGLLASVLLVSLNNARIKARDAKRRADVRQLLSALQLYAQSNNTYAVGGTGAADSGTGWFSFKGSTPVPVVVYNKSVAQGLVDAGFVAKVARDPSGFDLGTAAGATGYQIGTCTNIANLSKNVILYAGLEQPTAEDIANYTAIVAACGAIAPPVAGGGMNFAVQLK